jgi:hypothetical protein
MLNGLGVFKFGENIPLDKLSIDFLTCQAITWDTGALANFQ